MTGPTAPNVLVNWGVFYDGYNPAQQMNDGEAVPFAFENVSGTAIRKATDPTIVLAPNQTYMVDYTVTGTLQQTNTDYGMAIYHNGNPLFSTASNVDTFNNTAPTEGTFTGSGIITTGGGLNTIRLQLLTTPAGRSIELDNSNMRVVKIV
ncbi:hypothetical protein OIN60_22035 [Paenibacillus sp. P96]|uniref:BclA C-terminal domain-containing protein n=1 Tax=Paenibacillus zeirhizosphaerae TaxID=2987519 RepID=A0ABT9FY08_9BACL|nr:hypothetical protein [Paenibacillus sp. P96]MDP4099401.1 hypothetical protein [Paenibacillus sp. P96]